MTAEVRVDLATAILALDRTVKQQTETNRMLIGLMKDQIAESKLAREEQALLRGESKLAREEQALLRSEVASLSNEMVILRRDVELIRDSQVGRRARDSNGQ